MAVAAVVVMLAALVVGPAWMRGAESAVVGSGFDA